LWSGGGDVSGPPGPLRAGDVHLARALRELVQIVLAVDPDQPCVEDDRAANATVEMRR